MKPKPFYRRNLPHLQPAGGCFFVTFRLHGSIPLTKLRALKEKYDDLLLSASNEEEKYRLHKRYFGEYDRLLDAIECGPTYLEQAKVAEIVKEEMELWDEVLYDLLAYCIMPNHVHFLIDTSVQLQEGEVTNESLYLHQIMKKVKGRSAMFCNKHLNRPNQFWQRESYDHLVRDEKELLNIISYILENPVKAGLVKHWQEWSYSYWKSS